MSKDFIRCEQISRGLPIPVLDEFRRILYHTYRKFSTESTRGTGGEQENSVKPNRAARVWTHFQYTIPQDPL